MNRVEEKLSQWRRLYSDLSVARGSLDMMLGEVEGGPRVDALKSEVVRLNRESAAALAAVQVEIGTLRDRIGTWLP